MKKLLAILVIILCSIFSDKEIRSEIKTIKIQYFSFRPHIFIDETNNKPAGALYNLIENYIAPEMGIKFEWDDNTSFVSRQLENFKSGKEIASAVLAYSSERAQFVGFTQKPYFYDKPAIAVLKDNKLKEVKSIDDIINMTFGYADQYYISPFMKNDKIKFDMLHVDDFQETNLKKLIAKRIDAAYSGGNSILLYLIKQMNIENDIKVLNLPEKSVPYYIAFPKDMQDIISRYNKAFDKLDARNLYLKLLGKYLDVSKL